MREIADKIYTSTMYAGVNVGAVLTRKGLVCIDTPSYPRDARDWVSRLHQIDPRPIRYLLLTNGHGDRIINARWLNTRIVTHEATAAKLKGYDKRFPQMLLDSLITRDHDAGRELTNSPVEKASISLDTQMSLIINGLEIQLIHLPGPDNGNCAVYLPHENVMFTGDTVVVDSHPLLSQPTSSMWLNSLTALLDKKYQHTTFIPGRGSHATREDIEMVAAYWQDMQQRVKSVINNNQSRNEIYSFMIEFLLKYPLGRIPRDWLQAQIRSSLELVYEELTHDNHELQQMTEADLIKSAS
jgi:glyoxylase-like metal-dependent hydrolase (beta-lactamase superfamily II)